MNNQLNKSISITELVGIVRKKWWLLALCIIGTLTPILVYNHKATPIYRASTKVIFEDIEKMMDAKPNRSLDKETIISNLIEEMKTNSFAKEVYDALPEQMRKIFLLYSSYSIELGLNEYTLKQIKDNLSVELTKGTYIITIYFEAEYPTLAQFVANATADVLIKRNLANRRHKFSHAKTFIENQLESVKARLQKLENDIKKFKGSHDITSLADESREISQRMTQLENQYNQVNSQKKELQEKLYAIKSILKDEKKVLSNIPITGDAVATKLKERLVELEIRYINLQVQGYPTYHPKMLEIKNEIDRIKQTLVQKIKNEDNFVDHLTRIRTYSDELVNLEIELQAIYAKENNLQSLLKKYKKRIEQLPEIERDLIRLMREKESVIKIYEELSVEGEQARINEAAEIGNIRIIEPARLPTSPVRPRKLLNILVGLFSGMLLGSLLIFGIDYFNDSVKTEEDLEEAIDFPVIASIPKLKHDFSVLFDHNGNGKLHKKNKNGYILFDEYNLLYSALTHKKQRPSAIMITSSIPDEGKSTIATMLALTSAHRGEKTLLIDADLRRPSLHSVFDVPRNPGLTNLVVEFMNYLNNNTQRLNINDSFELRKDPKIQTILSKGLIQTFETNLLLLPCGFIPTHPVKAWSSKVWYKIIPQLKYMTDLIIIDAPPIIGVPDTTIMSSYVDHILFCVQADGIKKRTLERTFRMFKNAMKNSEEKIIGTVLNKVDLVNQYGKYKYYKYYTKNYMLNGM